MMIEFDIDEIQEEIKDLSYEDKMDFLEEKESDIEELIDELQGYQSEISSFRDEIETERNESICKGVLQSLKDAGYNFELDRNGNISFSLGKANISILMTFIDSKVDLFFEAEKNQFTYRELICSLLPDFKQDGNYFSQQITKEELNMCVVDVVSKLMNNKQKFEDI